MVLIQIKKLRKIKVAIPGYHIAERGQKVIELQNSFELTQP